MGNTGNRLRLAKPGSTQFQATLNEIQAEIHDERAARGAQLKSLLDRAGIDARTYNDLKLRHSPEDLVAAIWNFGPEFRSHLPSEEAPKGLPEQGWMAQWEGEHDARQDKITRGANGRPESE